MWKWLFALLTLVSIVLWLHFRSLVSLDGPLDIYANISLDNYDEWEKTAAKWQECSLSGCVNLAQCLLHPKRRLSIHVQPLLRIFDKNGQPIDCANEASREFLELREIIRKSNHHEPDPTLACLVLPGIDSTSLLKCSPPQFFALLKIAQSLLPSRANLLIVNLLITEQYLTISSPFPGIFVSTQHSHFSFRPGLDVAIPFVSHQKINPQLSSSATVERSIQILIILSHTDEPSKRDELVKLFSNEDGIRFVQNCPDSADQLDTFTVNYCESTTQLPLSQPIEHLISSSNFVLITDDIFLPQMVVWLALRHGSIPVVVSDKFVPPFSQSIDWYRFSFIFVPSLLDEIPRILRSVSADRIRLMRSFGSRIFTLHFASMERILDATIASLEGRIVPGRARTKLEWNTGRAGTGPILAPAICEQSQDKGQTLILVTDGEMDGDWSEVWRGTIIDTVIVVCRSEEQHKCPSIEAFSRSFPSIRFGSLHSPSLDLSDQFTSSDLHSTGPALVFVDLAHPSLKLSSFSTVSTTLSQAIQIWFSNCHALLLFPPPSIGPQLFFTKSPSIPTFGAAIAVVHKHLIAHFLSSKVPPICSSPSSNSTIGAKSFAICNRSESHTEL